MDTNEFDYYLIDSKDDESYPLIMEVGYKPNDINPKLILLEFNDPKPRNPVMADFLEGPEIYITAKIADIIKKFNPKGVKFIPTKLTDPKKNVYENYTCMLIDNDIEALDKEQSVFEKPRRVYFISKFVLDRKVLGEIPLEERLVLVPEESPDYKVFHKSVVDAIMAENPTGVQFHPLENWSAF